jgi:putative resolvase
MKLSAWAKANGLTYRTAWRMWRDGKLPIPAEQLATGTVIVHPPQAPSVDTVALYARVSSGDQKADLERQLGRLADYASREKLTVVRSVSEIGSGLNGHRAKIMRLLADPEVQTIVVEHRDRLARFGSEYIEATLTASGRRLVVVDQTEMKDDLVQDMVDVLTSFCARLYGRRAAKNRAAKALAAAGYGDRGRRRMILAHKIALDPGARAGVYFARASWTARFAWNWALADVAGGIRAVEGIPVRPEAIRSIPAPRVECAERRRLPVDAGGDEERATAGDQEPRHSLQELL